MGRKLYPYIYRGIVEDNLDPKNLGRCKVRVPSIHGELEYPISSLPWARPIAMTPIKADRGSVILPDIQSIVWVFFEEGIREFPVYFGGTYAIDELEISYDRVDFYVEGNTRISYDRDLDRYEIVIGTNSIKLDREGNCIIDAENTYCQDLSITGDLIVSGKLKVKELEVTDSFIAPES